MSHEIDILFQCPDRCCEIQSSDPAMGEQIIEELVSLALTDLFKKVIIQEITLTFPQPFADVEDLITISIRATGIGPLHTYINLDCVVESCLGSVLLELFGSLDVERCIVA